MIIPHPLNRLNLSNTNSVRISSCNATRGFLFILSRPFQGINFVEQVSWVFVVAA